MLIKRLFDLCCVIPFLLLLMPLFIFIIIWIKIDSRGSIFSRQIRIGQHGKPFFLLKFRTEYSDTPDNSARVTHCGAFLRHYKLDLLAQFFNVLKGDMSFVGPRPETPDYVKHYPKAIKKQILSVPAGMTDYASVAFQQEREIMATSIQPELDYIEKILPVKLAYHQQYVQQHNLFIDIGLIFKTIKRQVAFVIKRMYPRLLVILHDMIMVAVAWILAVVIRYQLPLELHVQNILWQVLPLVVLIQSLVLAYNGLHRSIWRFASIPDFSLILRSTLIGTLIIALSLFLFNRFEGIPRSSLAFYPLLAIFFLGTPRLLYRFFREQSISFLLRRQQGKRVLLLGAGSSGDMLARDMLRNPNGGYIPVGFLDDQIRLQGGKVQGVPVLGQVDTVCTVVEALKIDVIIIAMPSISDAQMRRIVELCEQCQKPFLTLPKLDNMMATGQAVNIYSLRDVSIDDLLGREKVQLDWHSIAQRLKEKVVMVSGGGGSIGAELCQQIARLNPTCLIIFERSEFNLYQIDMQLREHFPDLVLHACLGDVTDKVAVDHILERYKPVVVFHAAAYKHVPMLQDQTREAVRNNILGTQTLAEAADRHQCKAFVLISTDKAVNPTNIMGTTKRIAEIFCQALNARSETDFITVRFGNVLGSAGSVVPLFKKQIAKGGPVTVTHPEISRYFMTIPEACQLILQAGAMGEGGEIFVLDMGKPVTIRYLAEQMIRLSGKRPNEDIDIVYTGLRAGEKLYEELFHTEEKLRKTPHQKIFRAAHRSTEWQLLTDTLAELEHLCQHYHEAQMPTLLTRLVPEMHTPLSSSSAIPPPFSDTRSQYHHDSSPSSP